MPSLGDFFRFGVPRSFCAPWDAWLQSLLTQTRADLGARWEACYMSAPIWRFALAPGFAGPERAAGVLMPSVDRVGRAFPLTLVHVGAGGAPDYATLEEIALSALDDSMTKEKLALALAHVTETDAELKPSKGARWSTLLAGEILEFEIPTLPSGSCALGLFDPQAKAVRA
jgi:type VI secretion system protein ImpM